MTILYNTAESTHLKTAIEINDGNKPEAKQMHWLLGRRSTPLMESELLLYKAVLKPIWTYGIQL
jgi:hypothetical protein